jgi:hypothetical protein
VGCVERRSRCGGRGCAPDTPRDLVTLPHLVAARRGSPIRSAHASKSPWHGRLQAVGSRVCWAVAKGGTDGMGTWTRHLGGSTLVDLGCGGHRAAGNRGSMLAPTPCRSRDFWSFWCRRRKLAAPIFLARAFLARAFLARALSPAGARGARGAHAGGLCPSPLPQPLSTPRRVWRLPPRGAPHRGALLAADSGRPDPSGLGSVRGSRL